MAPKVYEHHGKMMDRYEELRKELHCLNGWNEDYR